MPGFVGDRGFMAQNADGARGGGRSQEERRADAREEAHLNRRLTAYALQTVEAVEGALSADLDPSEMEAAIQPCLRDLMAEAWPVLKMVVSRTYRTLVLENERDDHFVPATLSFFVTEKFLNPEEGMTTLLRKLSQVENSRGYLYKAGEKFTIDRLRKLGQNIEDLEPNKPDEDDDTLGDARIANNADPCPQLDLLGDPLMKRMLDVLLELPRDRRILLDLRNIAFGMLPRADVEYLAQQRGIPADDVQAELDVRYEALVGSGPGAPRRKLDKTYQRLTRYQRRLMYVKELLHEIKVTYPEIAVANASTPADPELITRLRHRPSQLRTLRPQLRWRCCVALQRDLADRIERLAIKVTELAAKGYGRPNWEEIAIILGEVDVLEPKAERDKAANRVTKRYSVLMKRVTAECLIPPDSEGQGG